MAVNVPELRTQERSFGLESDDLVIVGDRFRHSFVVRDRDDCTVLADFTGYTPAFGVFDDAGSFVLAGTVTPIPGDATGALLVELSVANTTTLGEATYAYRLTIDDGVGGVLTLFCGQFKLSICKAGE